MMYLVKKYSKNITFVDIVCLFILFGVLYWGLSGIRPLANPDEGRYVEIPREMIVSGDWVTPRLNGILYFEKPPAFYWLQAIALALGGVKEWVGRFWNCGFAVLGILATYGVGRRFWGRMQGIVSACVLGTAPIYFGMGHVITLDMMFSCFISLGLYAFILGVMSKECTKKRFFWFMGFYGALSVAVLTKGFMGILGPGAIIFLWIVLTRNWKKIPTFYIWQGTLLTLLITLPWHILAAKKTPEFAYFYLVHEQFLRYLQPLHGRGQPFYFCFAIFLLGMFPWTLFLPDAIRGLWSKKISEILKKPVELFLFIWGLFFITFFSFSKSQLVPYILPSFFPFALVVGIYIGGILENKRQDTSVYRPLKIYVGLTIGLALLAPGIVLKLLGLDADRMAWMLLILFAVLLSAIFVLKYIKKNAIGKAFWSFFIGFVCILVMVNPIIKDTRASTKPFAIYLKGIVGNEDKVFQIYNYYQDFAPYLGQITGVVDIPDEQKFGLSLENHWNRYLDEASFIKLWISNERVYGLIRLKHLEYFRKKINNENAFHILMQNHDFALLTNQTL